MADPLEVAYQEVLKQWRIDGLMQKLFWYDNLPADEEIVQIVKEIRRLQREELPNEPSCS